MYEIGELQREHIHSLDVALAAYAPQTWKVAAYWSNMIIKLLHSLVYMVFYLYFMNGFVVMVNPCLPIVHYHSQLYLWPRGSPAMSLTTRESKK
jgi:hypothetical protein